MFRLTHSLRFPRLDFIRNVEFSAQDKTSPLFKLNWAEVDQYHEEKWKEWKTKHWPNSDSVYSYKFPEKYETLLQDALFVIPKNYLDEIRRMTQQAVLEWGTERSFDTSIREMCLEPAIAFVSCAFRLLEDCLYDPKTNYYSRGDGKVIMSSLMLYRFWQHQTGRGLIEDHAGFDRLKSIEKYAGAILRSTINEFLEAFKEYYIKIDKAYDIRSGVVAEVPGVEPGHPCGR